MPIEPVSRLFDDIYQKPEEIRYWLGQPAGKNFLRAMREWKLDYEARLRKADFGPTIHRAQGALEVLDRILQLKEELEEVQTKGGNNNVVGSQGQGKVAGRAS